MITFGFMSHKLSGAIFHKECDHPPSGGEMVEVPITLFMPFCEASGRLEERIKVAVEKMVKGLNDGNE